MTFWVALTVQRSVRFRLSTKSIACTYLLTPVLNLVNYRPPLSQGSSIFYAGVCLQISVSVSTSAALHDNFRRVLPNLTPIFCWGGTSKHRSRLLMGSIGRQILERLWRIEFFRKTFQSTKIRIWCSEPRFSALPLTPYARAFTLVLFDVKNLTNSGFFARYSLSCDLIKMFSRIWLLITRR